MFKYIFDLIQDWVWFVHLLNVMFVWSDCYPVCCLTVSVFNSDEEFQFLASEQSRLSLDFQASGLKTLPPIRDVCGARAHVHGHTVTRDATTDSKVFVGEMLILGLGHPASLILNPKSRSPYRHAHTPTCTPLSSDSFFSFPLTEKLHTPVLNLLLYTVLLWCH